MKKKKKIPTYAVYNKFEVGLKSAYSRLKLFLLKPLVVVLHKIGISPNLISFCGFIASLVFYLKLAVFNSQESIVIICLLYLFLDNLDGALAEYRGADESGPVVDNFYDLVSLLLILLGLAANGSITHASAFVFEFLYFVIIAGGFILSYNSLPVLLLRPRIILFSAFLLSAIPGLGPFDLEPWIQVAILIQIPSVVSVLWVTLRNLNKLQIPQVLGLLSRESRALALIALVFASLAVLNTLPKGG